MTLHFATLFNINYLSRGLALINSLTKHSSQNFRLFVLALDENVISYFETNPVEAVITIRPDEMESHFPELKEAKANRSTVEYFFTLSPYLPLYILDKYSEVDRITSMDADIYFFDDPAKIFAAYPDASVLITPHHFSPALQHLIIYGKYNVSFQSFKNDESGRMCLEDWRQSCFTWCSDYYDKASNRYADQKYLDTWAEKFEGVQDIDLSGAGAAPWNIEKYNWQLNKQKVSVDGEPLIYYHFHNLRLFNRYFAFNGLERYQANARNKAVKYVYHTYLKKLLAFSGRQPRIESKILRHNDLLSSNLITKLKNPEGYWFFNRLFIAHLNPQKVKKILKHVWPG